MPNETCRNIDKAHKAASHHHTASGRWLCNPFTAAVNIVGPQCSIAWNKTDDPKVTDYQLSVVEQSKQANAIVRFIPADTTKVSCKDAGASHEGLWDVTVSSCYNKTTCGSPTEVRRVQITAN
jgi:hypothetical protein